MTPLPWVARIAVHRFVFLESAGLALPALGRIERDHMVAFLERRDSAAHVDNDSGALVAQNDRE
jgi:hypothetical protein